MIQSRLVSCTLRNITFLNVTTKHNTNGQEDARSETNILSPCIQHQSHAVPKMLQSRLVSCNLRNITILSVTTNHNTNGPEDARSETNLQSPCIQRQSHAVPTMIQSRLVSCTLRNITILSATTNHNTNGPEDARSETNLQSPCIQRQSHAVPTMIQSRLVSCTLRNITIMSVTTNHNTNGPEDARSETNLQSPCIQRQSHAVPTMIQSRLVSCTLRNITIMRVTTNHNTNGQEDARSETNLQSPCIQRQSHAVPTMIQSRLVSCNLRNITILSVTTNHNTNGPEDARSETNLQSPCIQRQSHAVPTMIQSRLVSCTLRNITIMRVTTNHNTNGQEDARSETNLQSPCIQRQSHAVPTMIQSRLVSCTLRNRTILGATIKHNTNGPEDARSETNLQSPCIHRKSHAVPTMIQSRLVSCTLRNITILSATTNHITNGPEDARSETNLQSPCIHRQSHAVPTMIQSRLVSCTLRNITIMRVTTNHNTNGQEDARSETNLQSPCIQRQSHAVPTMIQSRLVSCTLRNITFLSVTIKHNTTAQKMQEAKRIFNHHAYSVRVIPTYLTYRSYSTTYPTYRTHPQLSQLIELTVQLSQLIQLTVQLIQLIELILNLSNSSNLHSNLANSSNLQYNLSNPSNSSST